MAKEKMMMPTSADSFPKALKEKIERCTTRKQVMKVLAENNLKVYKDTTDEMGRFSIWIDELTRIYQPYGQRNMKVQKWKKVDVYYSGIPTFFW